jgi:hypothetical protein
MLKFKFVILVRKQHHFIPIVKKFLHEFFVIYLKIFQE